MSIIRQSRDGLDYQPRFGERMRGTGVFADLLNSRFKIACKRLGYPPDRRFELDISRFRAPHPQLSLFD
jgi:DNA repair photolyase